MDWVAPTLNYIYIYIIYISYTIIFVNINIVTAAEVAAKEREVAGLKAEIAQTEVPCNWQMVLGLECNLLNVRMPGDAEKNAAAPDFQVNTQSSLTWVL